MSEPTNLAVKKKDITFAGSPSHCGSGSEVARWLSSHGMQEWINALAMQGYDDMEDLRTLCARDTDTFEAIVTKPGHRKKIQRLLNNNDIRDELRNQPGDSSPSIPIDKEEGTKEDPSPSSLVRSPRSTSAFSPASSRSSVNKSNTAAAGGVTPTQSQSNRRSFKQTIPSIPAAPLASSPTLTTTGESILPMRSPREPSSVSEVADDILLKIIVVGESGSGKTSFIRQLVEGRFTNVVKSTVGLDFNEKRFITGDTAITVQFWDISGQERFASMTRAYYKGAHGAMVCYDVTRPRSFDMVAKWKQDIEEKVFLNEQTMKAIPAILLGCKCDCEKKVEKTNVELAKYCLENNFVGWFECSAKTGYNVREASEFLVSHAYKEVKENGSNDREAMLAATPAPYRNTPGLEKSVQLTQSSPKKSSSCC